MDVARGDIAAIETGISRSQTGTVSIESVSGEFNVTLTFANIDGRRSAVLYFNTYLAGNETAVADLAYTAARSDRVAVERRESVSGGPLPTGAYDVTIETNSGTERKRVMVDDPRVGDLTLLRAPGDRFESFDTDEDLDPARRAGYLTDPPTTGDGPQAALGDTMVYRLNVTGLYGLLAAQGGSSAEANFRALLADGEGRDALGLDIRASGSCDAAVDVPASVAAGNMRVVPDSTNESLYVTTDLRRVERSKGDPGGFVGTGRATYTVFGGTHISDSNVTTGLDYAVAERTYAYDGDDRIVRRDSASGQSVSGETSLAPGTRLQLNVTAVGSDYEERVPANVSAGGTFKTELDLSDAPERARFTLSVAQIERSETLLTTGGAPETAVWFVEDRTSGDAIERVDSARVALEDGGFLAVYRVPADETVSSDDLVGHSEPLQRGVHDPDIRLAEPLDDSESVVLVAHRDDGNGRFDYPADDSPYRTGGDPIYSVGRVVLAGDSSKPPRVPRFLSVRLPPADEATGTAVTSSGPAPTRSPTPTATPAPVSTTELPPPTLRGTETPDPTATTLSPRAADRTAVENATATANGTAVGGGATDGSTEGLGPGFGPVTVLTAVAALTLLAVRRRG